MTEKVQQQSRVVILVTSNQLNSSDNSDAHIRLLATHPHLVSTDFIHRLPAATSSYYPCPSNIVLISHEKGVSSSKL